LPLYSRGDEAPASVDQKAQPATDRQPRKTAQAVTATGSSGGLFL
jgi:hypothetical protein